ncbi:hypothetical protein [Rufibacter immobilis]|uniref:hypothetical protein n=1 Tax=Rufibacter immobilis TaxID=1348778 RepID=UPI0035E7EF9C
MASFQTPTFSVREAGITAKRFHGWHHAGLLPFGIPEGRKNLLTFPEFIWVRLIDRLRTLGYPLGGIYSLKQFLFETRDGELAQDQAEQRPSLLETVLARQLADGGEVGVVLIPQGKPQVWMEASGGPRPNGTHLYLSLSEQVRDFRANRALEGKERGLGLFTLLGSRETGMEATYDRQTEVGM